MKFVIVLCLVVVCIGVGIKNFINRSILQNEKIERTNGGEEIPHTKEESGSWNHLGLT